MIHSLKSHPKPSHTFKGDKDIYRKFWNRIQKSARQRNLEFNITMQEAWEIFIKQNQSCAVTGLPIHFETRSGRGDGNASLDRIDSSKGYTADNIQWVCKEVDKLKWDKTELELVQVCKKVINYNQRKTFFNIPMEDIAFIVSELGQDNFIFEDKTILLTGAFGFLGKLFQSYFLYLNENVLRSPCFLICLDNNIVGSASVLEIPNFTYVCQDICRSVIENEIVSKRTIDYIINAAGIASPLLYHKFPMATIDVSYLGTKNILDLCRVKKVSSALFFSSSEVYGDPDDKDIPTNEDCICKIRTMDSRSCYDTGKVVLETLCHIAHQQYGINVKIVRPFNVFGYIPKSDGRVIPNFLSNVLSNKKIKIYGGGGQTRTFCWFSDFIVGAMKVLLHGGNTPYNIGNTDNEISMLDLAKLVEKVSGKTDCIETIPIPNVYAHEPRRRCPDISLAQKELGYSPKVSLEEGIKKFYSWANSHSVYNNFQI